MCAAFESVAGQRDNLRPQLTVAAHGQQSDGNGQLEAAGAAGAGIEIEDAFSGIEIRRMGVAAEDGGEFGGHGIKVEGIEIVEHIDVAATMVSVAGEHDFRLGQPGARALAIDVAANGGDGRDLF